MLNFALVDGSAHGSALRTRQQSYQQDQVVSTFNFVLSLTILLLLIPLLVIVATAIYLQDGGPVLFSQERVGRRGRTFRCLKFRTMTVNAESRLERLLATDPRARAEWAKDQKLRQDPRITRLGAILRKSSLDELPQLVNVLRGEMSLVGPRPIVQAEVCRYGRRIAYYQAVKPGITGLWQVSGRNDIDYRRRVAMDCLYVRKKSLAYDGWLLVRTIPAVLIRRGCY